MGPKQPSKPTESQISPLQPQVLEDWFDDLGDCEEYLGLFADLPEDTFFDADDELYRQPQTISQQQPPDNLFDFDILEPPENLRNAEPFEEEPISVQHLLSILAPIQSPLGPLPDDEIREYPLQRTSPVATREPQPQPLPTRSRRQSKRPRLTEEEITPYKNMLLSDAAERLRVHKSTLSRYWNDLTGTGWPGPSGTSSSSVLRRQSRRPTTRESMVAMQDTLQTMAMHLRNRDARMLHRDAAMQSKLSQMFDAIDLHCPRETQVENQNETHIRCTSRPSPVRNQDEEENLGGVSNDVRQFMMDKRVGSCKLNVLPYTVGISFWETLAGSASVGRESGLGYLEDMHIDAWSSLLIQNRPENELWTIMPCDFVTNFGSNDTYLKFGNGTELQYPAWWKVERVILPIGIGHQHWITVEFHLKSLQLILFDNSKELYKELVKSKLEQLEPDLSLYLIRIGYNKHVIDPLAGRRTLISRYANNVPQISNSNTLGDCGVWVCNQIECLTNATTLVCEGETHLAALEYRRRMLEELYATLVGVYFR